MISKYLRKDVKHFLVNLVITVVAIILFYSKFGFYGWPHLLSVLFLHYSVLPLDDWIEGERPFPYYCLPLIAFAGYFFPLVTFLALLGDVIVNLRAITKKNYFLLERLEALGDVLIYVLPFTIPIGLNNPSLYIAAILFITFADSFHKIGHKETLKPKLMWATGIVSLLIGSYLFRTSTLSFSILLGLTLFSLLPFVLVKKKSILWSYSQGWFGFASFVGFYYYLYFVI